MDNDKFAALPDPETEPTVSVERAGQVIGISRGSAYEGVRRGEIPSIRIGHRVLIPTAALLRLVGIRIDGPTVADSFDDPPERVQSRSRAHDQRKQRTLARRDSQRNQRVLSRP